MTDDAARLAAVLTKQYASGRVTLTAARHGLNPVFLVQREHGPAWVVRTGRNLPRFAQTILFLEERGYPAPRLGGQPVTPPAIDRVLLDPAAQRLVVHP